ncbi:MAG: hypothetical protein QOE13_3551 [Gaiellaceae bacterium]|jgi:hypothetical protein|nr:hypothetical protein [Gaiellaceae bacterium]
MMAVNKPTHSRRAYRLLGVGDAHLRRTGLRVSGDHHELSDPRREYPVRDDNGA